jgi:hypothetical protein
MHSRTLAVQDDNNLDASWSSRQAEKLLETPSDGICGRHGRGCETTTSERSAVTRTGRACIQHHFDIFDQRLRPDSVIKSVKSEEFVHQVELVIVKIEGARSVMHFGDFPRNDFADVQRVVVVLQVGELPERVMGFHAIAGTAEVACNFPVAYCDLGIGPSQQVRVYPIADVARQGDEQGVCKAEIERPGVCFDVDLELPGYRQQLCQVGLRTLVSILVPRIVEARTVGNRASAAFLAVVP